MSISKTNKTENTEGVEKTEKLESVLDTAVKAKVLANKHESLVFVSL